MLESHSDPINEAYLNASITLFEVDVALKAFTVSAFLTVWFQFINSTTLAGFQYPVVPRVRKVIKVKEAIGTLCTVSSHLGNAAGSFSIK